MKVDLDSVAIGCVVSDCDGNLFRKVSPMVIHCENAIRMGENME